MPDNDVTFVVPIFNLQSNRIENLKFILPFLLKTGKKVILAEQVNCPKSELKELVEKIVLEQYSSNFKHVLYFNSHSLIHKSGIINWATQNFVETKYVWVNDVDFYMKFDLVLNQPWSEKFIKPYNHGKKLTEEESKKIINGEKLAIDFSDNNAGYISLFAALSFIYEKETFLSIGGMNEGYFGWGGEDTDFYNKIVSLNYTIKSFDYKGIHLWHPMQVNAERPQPVEPIQQVNEEPSKNNTPAIFPVVTPVPIPEFWNINNYFNKIYCINLNKRIERWENVERQLKLANINVTRFEGIDGENLPLKNSLLSGELGCLYSHIEVIKDAKRNEYQKILILEDDIILPKNINKVLEEIKNIPWDWKLLYLGASQLDWTDIELTDKKYYKCKNTYGTFAYSIDCSLFDEIIATAQKFNKPIDICLTELQNKYKENSFVLYPNLIISDTRTSDIRESKEIYSYAERVKWNLNDFSLFNNDIKKILLLPDARNWAFDNIAKAIVKYNPYPDKIYYSINYTRDLHLKKTTINPNDWDLIYIMFEGERLIPPAKNIIRGCYSAFWLEYTAFTPEFMSTYFSKCAGAVFVNPELHRLFKPYLPSTFPTEIIYDSSDEFLFYPIKHKKNKEFTAIYVGNTKRPIKNFQKIQSICQTAGVNLHVCKNIPNKELVHEYNKADILINFSDFEGGPQTFVEASLCEVPTLIRDTNELSKVIPCFTGKTEEDFINILIRLKNNREECALKGFEAYNVAINNLTYKKTALKFANYFLSFTKNNLKDKLTVFVINAGNNPNYDDCIKALQEQKCIFQLKTIENIAPMSRAFQKMIDECETEYYIQVDSDMILQPDAIETIYNALVSSDKNISTVAHMLKDTHLEFNIYGIKGYKHNVLKNYPYNLEIISCEVEQVRRLQKDGYQTLMVNKVLGEHSPKWTSSLIYERYFDLIEKWKNFKYDWMNELPSKLLQIFKDNPSEINFYALAGAMMSLSTEVPLRNREKNFLIEDSNFERIKKAFEERTFKYMVNKAPRRPEVLSREHMFGNNKQ